MPIDTATGRVNTTIIVAAPSANVTLTIPNGTKAVDTNGTPLTNITINTGESLTTNASFALSTNDTVLGHIVELKPEGARFDPPIQIKFNYSLPLPGGVNENSLTVRYFNVSTNTWEDMETVEHNTVQKYIIANIPHFSTYALIGTVITTKPSSGGGGNSGGGGGGGTSGENVSNIEVIEKYDLQISKDSMTSYRFTHEKNPIIFINVIGNTSLGIITASVEVLKDTSTLVKTPPQGLVYKNANIWVGTSGYATPKNIKEAHIKFRVLNSWISDNNLASKDVKLLKWDGSKWTQLDTTQERADAVHTYYDVKTVTFSHFAISGVKGFVIPTATLSGTETPVSIPQTGEETATPQKTTYTTTELLTALTGLGLPITGGNVNLSWIYSLIILLIIAIGVRFGLAFFIKQRKKKEK